MRNVNPKLRVSLYVILAAAGAALVTYGIISQDVYDAIAPVVAGVLMVAGGGVATANTSVKPRQSDPSIMEWARMGQDAIPALLDEVQRARDAKTDDPPAVVSTYSGGSSVPDVSPSTAGLPVWDMPSSTDSDGDYVGQHRREA